MIIFGFNWFLVRVGGGWMGFKEFLLSYNSIVAEPIAKGINYYLYYDIAI